MDFEIIKISLELILRGKASVGQISAILCPFGQAAVIEHLEFLVDDKRNDIIAQALLEKNQSANTTVSILKRVDMFKAVMEIKDLFKRLFLLCVVTYNQRFHFIGNILRKCSISTAYLVGKLFIIADNEPRLAAIGSTVLENTMQFLDEALSQNTCSIFNN